MRGLAVFISDIRNCKSKEAEIKRINKELANIRSKFKGDKTLDGYQKKKYVCKLLFIFLLGHDIDFGHMEAVNLLSSNKYTEKQIVSHQRTCTIRIYRELAPVSSLTQKWLSGAFLTSL